MLSTFPEGSTGNIGDTEDIVTLTDAAILGLENPVFQNCAIAPSIMIAAKGRAVTCTPVPISGAASNFG